jgi:hypothetical protein
MATTTVPAANPLPVPRGRVLWLVALVFTVAVVCSAAAFAIGRTTAHHHTVIVPAAQHSTTAPAGRCTIVQHAC